MFLFALIAFLASFFSLQTTGNPVNFLVMAIATVVMYIDEQLSKNNKKDNS